jgi:hypothetical protein
MIKYFCDYCGEEMKVPDTLKISIYTESKRIGKLYSYQGEFYMHSECCINILKNSFEFNASDNELKLKKKVEVEE